MTPLEVLYAAKAHIADPANPWEFVDWKSCTCGHIYTAATGRRSRGDHTALTSRSKPYRAAIYATARVLYPSRHPRSFEEAASLVSNATSARATRRRGSDIERKDAIYVIDKAIKAIEAQHEADRLDVLAQTQAIIDNVDLREPALA